MRSIGPMSMTVIMASFMTKPAVAEASLPDACKAWASAQQTAEAPADCAKALKMPVTVLDFKSTSKSITEKTLVDTGMAYGEKTFEVVVPSTWRVDWKWFGRHAWGTVTVMDPKGRISLVRDIENGYWFTNRLAGKYRFQIKTSSSFQFSLKAKGQWTVYDHAMTVQLEVENPFAFPIKVSGQGFENITIEAGENVAVLKQRLTSSKPTFNRLTLGEFFEKARLNTFRLGTITALGSWGERANQAQADAMAKAAAKAAKDKAELERLENERLATIASLKTRIKVGRAIAIPTFAIGYLGAIGFVPFGLNSENPNVFWGLAVAAGAGLAVGVTTGYWVKGLEKEHKRLSK